MTKALLYVSFSLMCTFLGCERKDGSPRTQSTSQVNGSRLTADGRRSEEFDSTGYVTDRQVSAGQRTAMNNRKSRTPDAKNAVCSLGSAKERQSSTKAVKQMKCDVTKSQRTIRDSVESTGRELDTFEEQMDRLQVAVEGLLED